MIYINPDKGDLLEVYLLRIDALVLFDLNFLKRINVEQETVISPA
jgi:hypothetical protein